MKILRFALPLAPALAVVLAMGTTAEPTRQVAPQAPAPADDQALDASPAPEPARAVAPERVRGAAELPAAARSGVWRGGARPPGEVPASVVVRTAMRNASPKAKSRGRAGPEADVPRSIEIVWNAPGS